VITDGDLVLGESGAIIEYIVARYGNGRLVLGPDHPDYAHFVYWFHFANGTLQPATGRCMMLGRLDLPADHPMLRAMKGRMELALGQVQARLAKADYFAGPEFTTADIMIVFTLTTMRLFLPFGLAPYPAILGYLGALLFGTVYTSAKALAIAVPVITLLIFGGLLQPGPTGGAAFWRWALAGAVALGMAASSFLVLHQAPVAPQSHAGELAELRPLVQGRRVLFLGRDNFILYELRGARPFTAVRNYYDPNYVKPNLRLKDVFQKFDFDSVTARTLARFPFVITTRAAYASGPPPAFKPLRATPDFVLWKRVGAVGERRTLPEGDQPGALLDCSTARGRRVSNGQGSATVFTSPPVMGGTWSPSSTVESGSTSSQTLTLPAGRWEISISYDATRTLHVTAPGLDASLPTNLDYRGSVPYYAAGQLATRHRGPVRFTVGVERPPLAGRLLGTKSVAHLGAIAASPAARGGPLPGEGERPVKLGHSCGRYLDWYRPHGAG
jgi:hypothetical protein